MALPNHWGSTARGKFQREMERRKNAIETVEDKKTSGEKIIEKGYEKLGKKVGELYPKGLSPVELSQKNVENLERIYTTGIKYKMAGDVERKMPNLKLQ